MKISNFSSESKLFVVYECTFIWPTSTFNVHTKTVKSNFYQIENQFQSQMFFNRQATLHICIVHSILWLTTPHHTLSMQNSFIFSPFVCSFFNCFSRVLFSVVVVNAIFQHNSRFCMLHLKQNTSSKWKIISMEKNWKCNFGLMWLVFPKALPKKLQKKTLK